MARRKLLPTTVHSARTGGAVLTAELVERPIALADLLPYAPREDRADIECSNYYDSKPQARIGYLSMVDCQASSDSGWPVVWRCFEPSLAWPYHVLRAAATEICTPPTWTSQ